MNNKLVKPIVENLWTFWSQVFFFCVVATNFAFNCCVAKPTGLRSPILATYPPPEKAQNQCARFVYLKCRIQRTERDAWRTAVFALLPVWEAPGEMAHVGSPWRDGARPMAGSDVGVCETSKVYQKAREKI